MQRTVSRGQDHNCQNLWPQSTDILSTKLCHHRQGHRLSEQTDIQILLEQKMGWKVPRQNQKASA